MRLPRGTLLRSRVVDDPAVVLSQVLDDELTGYAVLEPQDSLLLAEETTGVLTFEAGVPVLAYDVASDDGGSDALADLAVPGPYRAKLYELPTSALAEIHDTQELRVPPGAPAEQVADDVELADRTRAAAPEDRTDAGTRSAVEAFLRDDAKIEAIREQARSEARQRAEEWGLSDSLVEDDDGGRPSDENVSDGDSSDEEPDDRDLSDEGSARSSIASTGSRSASREEQVGRTGIGNRRSESESEAGNS